ncbi:hypothetical protein [Streptosporangium sp. V21-05]|uniref:hypothetical protein n=1 Tax=Streptosporangium sp. V21-05 TaxID=3446115 RepID=UPI003F538EBC
MTTTTTTRRKTATGPGTDAFARRVASADWQAVTDEINEYGCALLPQSPVAAM